MSWSFQAIGKPERVVEAIEAAAAKQTGQCKLEFDAAKPHLVGLVRENFSVTDTRLVKIQASGSGSCDYNNKDADGNPVQAYRSCSVLIEPFYGEILL